MEVLEYAQGDSVADGRAEAVGTPCKAEKSHDVRDGQERASAEPMSHLPVDLKRQWRWKVHCRLIWKCCNGPVRLALERRRHDRLV